MPLPLLSDKVEEEAYITPKEATEYFIDEFEEQLPKGVIICYDSQVLDLVEEEYDFEKGNSPIGESHVIQDDGGNETAPIWVIKVGIGAPTASIALEHLICLGIDNFISVGTAGALQEYLEIGDVVVCDEALRDEGTSYHYLPPSKYIEAPEKITDKIIETLEKEGQDYHVGPSWTIDAPNRETEREIKRYQDEDVLTVEMETSALFSVAEYRDVQVGSIFTISDRLTDSEWEPKFLDEKVDEGLRTVLKKAVKAL